MGVQRKDFAIIAEESEAYIISTGQYMVCLVNILHWAAILRSATPEPIEGAH